MSDLRRGAASRFFHRLRHPLLFFRSERRETYADLIRRAAQTQTLDDLMRHVANEICSVLELESLHLFVLETDERGRDVYRLSGAAAGSMEFAASSATVLRMRRESRPTSYDPTAGPGSADGWQMLAGANELEMLRQLGAQLLFPLAGRTGLMGFVVLARPGRRSFLRSEKDFLYRLGRPMGVGLETALLLRKLTAQAVERERAARDLALAREVQAHLLPQELPVRAGVEFAAFYRSAGEVGGDLYDVLLTPAGKLCVVVADVSGKGVAAALLMAALRAALQTLVAAAERSAAELVTELNDILYQSSSTSQYATVFVCLYDPRQGTMEYCNAGHTPPLLLQTTGDVVPLTTGGTVVGLLASPTYENGTAALAGGSLVAYTDGISEATNAALEEWSERGLRRAMLTAPTRGAAALLGVIREQLEQFVDGAAQADDMTLLVISSCDTDGATEVPTPGPV